MPPPVLQRSPAVQNAWPPSRHGGRPPRRAWRASWPRWRRKNVPRSSSGSRRRLTARRWLPASRSCRRRRSRRWRGRIMRRLPRCHPSRRRHMPRWRLLSSSSTQPTLRCAAQQSSTWGWCRPRPRPRWQPQLRCRLCCSPSSARRRRPASMRRERRGRRQRPRRRQGNACSSWLKGRRSCRPA